MKQYFQHRLLFGYGGIGISILLYGCAVLGLIFGRGIDGLFLALALILIGSIFSFSKLGAGIDVEAKTLFKYYQILGVKIIRKRVSLADYSCLLVLIYRTRWTYYTRATEGSRVEQGYSVTLANNTHKKKYDLAIVKTLDQAKSLSSTLSKSTELPIQKYNPPKIGKRRR